MKLLYISLNFISICLASDYVLINCSWPCPNISHGCILTAQEAHCGERTSNNWIINTPQKAPYYTGAYISVQYQPCHPAPIPILPIVNLNNKTEIGQTIIKWPIENIRRPHDEYLGNCGHGFYCSSAGSDSLFPICRPRLQKESNCISSNQCTTNFCFNQTCQINNQDNILDRNNKWNHNNTQHKDKTAQILASVFGIVGGIVMLGIAFIVYRKHKKKKNLNQSLQTGSNLPLHQQFASDFQHDEIMAQSQVEYLKPPPSYTP